MQRRDTMTQLRCLLLSALLALAAAGQVAADTSLASGPAAAASQYTDTSTDPAAGTVAVSRSASVLPASTDSAGDSADSGTVSLDLASGSDAPPSATVSSNPGSASTTPGASSGDGSTAPHLVKPANTWGIDAGGSAQKEIVSLVDTQSGVNQLGTSGEAGFRRLGAGWQASSRPGADH